MAWALGFVFSIRLSTSFSFSFSVFSSVFTRPKSIIPLSVKSAGVCVELKKKLFELAKKQHKKSLGKVKFEQVNFANGHLIISKSQKILLTDILKSAKKENLSVSINNKPKEVRDNYSCHAHSCIMVEVNVDEDLGMITIPRVVIAVAAGKIINPKTT